MKILYFGPIAKAMEPAKGGFEAANRKNIDMLRKHGLDVVEYPNPKIHRRLGAFGKLAYIKLLVTPLCLIQYLGKKDLLVHITPLYNHLLWPSVWLVWVAKTLNIKFIIDIRAGSLINLSKSKSEIWKRGIRYMLQTANHITVEGKSYINDIPKVFGVNKPISYFPNTTYCKDSEYIERNDKYINLIYFGRITKHKGVDLMMRMMSLLGDNYHLYLAGPISGEIETSQIQIKNVFYLGSLSPVELSKTLKKMHIFMFPTKWAGEGQSNSLIEAMQAGLIPIASDQGFNSDVIDECGAILTNESDENAYRDAVLKISSGNLKEQGMKAVEQINRNHNISVWIPKLIQIYREILK